MRTSEAWDSYLLINFVFCFSFFQIQYAECWWTKSRSIYLEPEVGEIPGKCYIRV